MPPTRESADVGILISPLTVCNTMRTRSACTLADRLANTELELHLKRYEHRSALSAPRARRWQCRGPHGASSAVSPPRQRLWRAPYCRWRELIIMHTVVSESQRADNAPTVRQLPGATQVIVQRLADDDPDYRTPGLKLRLTFGSRHHHSYDMEVPHHEHADFGYLNNGRLTVPSDVPARVTGLCTASPQTYLRVE